MPHNLRRKTRLDELAAGKLPERLIESINQMELTVEEALEWQEGKPAVRIVGTEEGLRIRLQLDLPINKKTIAALGSISASVGLLITFLLENPHFWEIVKQAYNFFSS
jgi:hypothetical protein